MVLMLYLVPMARAATAGEAVARLSAQRQANGIPAGIVESPDWSGACALHNRYEKANGGGLTHDEDPANPGYTEAGAWAGRNSVLHGGSGWDAGNPFETAPIHLSQLLAPYLAVTGVDDSNGFVCATTWPGYVRPDPPAPTVYSYPGNGTAGIYYREVASESPFVPGAFVGLPDGSATGPYLYVFAAGPGMAGQPGQIAAASLAGPNGPVEVRVVDNTTGQVGPYLPSPSGMLIPVNPLPPRTTFLASVTLVVAGAPLGYQWSFTTASAPCRTVRTLHTVRYRQRYRDRQGHRHRRWRTKAHLHRKVYRDRRGHRRVRWDKHYITRRVCE